MDFESTNILDWDEHQVQGWLTSLGYPQYEEQIKEHKISGEVLCIIDSDSLKDVGIATIGQRLGILKQVYLLKLAQDITIQEDDYVPPSELSDRNSEAFTVHKLSTIVTEQAIRLRNLEDENRLLNDSFGSLVDDFNTLRLNVARSAEDNTPLKRQPSFKWAQYVKPARSPTKLDIIESPHPSPQQLEHDISHRNNVAANPFTNSAVATSNTNSMASTASTSTIVDKPRPPPIIPPTQSPGGTTHMIPPKPQRSESSDNLKSFKVSLDDPTWKVLPAALKKYRINNDNWQNYAMFICYGSTGNRIERCLSYDEKPLLLFQKLKDAKKNPVFMLKHIKDIRSPIAVAQQKHAARKASSVISAGSEIASTGHALNKSTPMGISHQLNSTPSTTLQQTPQQQQQQQQAPQSSLLQQASHLHSGGTRTQHRPPRLEVNDLSLAAPSLSNLSPQPGWPEGGVSPLVEHGGELPLSSARTTNTTFLGTGSTESLRLKNANNATGAGGSHLANGVSTPVTGGGAGYHANGGTGGNGHGGLEGEATSPASARELPVSNAGGVSYAVAIYPYMAEQEDEFDVVVGDAFVILSRARGWWVVQRDPTGSGVVDVDTNRQGWVPAGCLLETNVPVASAIAEATAAKRTSRNLDGASSSSSGSPPDSSSTVVSKTPILPLSIISTSFPGVALMDYQKKGEEELDLVKDDALRVFKRYNHWSYSVKEEGGDRGWVPSWFIGKVAAASGTPATPSTSVPSHLQNASDDATVSPMSSAFPPPVNNSTRVGGNS